MRSNIRIPTDSITGTTSGLSFNLDFRTFRSLQKGNVIFKV